ncbi:hypothetical protein D3C87_1575370 [compost metagenome]
MCQPKCGDKRANQACTGQIDAFAKRPAQYGKANTLAFGGELIEKLLTLLLCHRARLRPQVDLRIALGQ